MDEDDEIYMEALIILGDWVIDPVDEFGDDEDD